MKPMSRVGIVAAVALAGVAFHGTSHAAGSSRQDSAVLSQLAGAAIPPAQLGRLRAEGSASISVNEAKLTDNSVGPNSVTGSNTIAANSVSNNNGITTVFQNTGNNSLFQNSTAIYISIH